jgi:hypothetical protein
MMRAGAKKRITFWRIPFGRDSWFAGKIGRLSISLTAGGQRLTGRDGALRRPNSAA